MKPDDVDNTIRAAGTRLASAPVTVPALDQLLRRHRRRRTVAFGSAVALSIAVTAVSLTAAGRSASPSLVASGTTDITGSTATRGPSQTPTFGSIPPEAMPPGGGDVNLGLVPDYVSVAAQDSDEIIGYIRKEDLFPTDEQLQERGPSSPEEAAAHGGVFVDVYNVYDTNERVIGHWVSGAGFVPLSGDVDAAVQSVLDGTTNSGSGSGP